MFLTCGGIHNTTHSTFPLLRDAVSRILGLSTAFPEWSVVIGQMSGYSYDVTTPHVVPVASLTLKLGQRDRVKGGLRGRDSRLSLAAGLARFPSIITMQPTPVVTTELIQCHKYI